MNGDSRSTLVEETMAAFVELILTQKFTDIPGWVDSSLTVSQLRAIFFLAFKGPLTVSELANHLGMGRPAASILVQQLVQQGFADRTEDVEDRRRLWVKLTERGRALMNGRIESKEVKFRNWFGQMSDEDLTGLQRGLATLLDIMRTDQPEPVSEK